MEKPTDPCVSAIEQREQDAKDCRDWLVENNVLPVTATVDDATNYFEDDCDGECDECPVWDGCPVCERYE